MDLQGVCALVTGASRGLGRTFAEALVERGCERVYAGARNPARHDDSRITPLQLDITDPRQVTTASEHCAEVSLLINNAGVMKLAPLLGAVDLSAARAEMETNYFGTLQMCRAFAPVLARNGGGAIVNVLSAASWYALPFNGSYCASKSAQWALTNAIRTEVRAQATLVVGVHAGYIDTEMTSSVEDVKLPPESVVAQTLDAVESGAEEVLADEVSRMVRDSIPRHLSTLYPKVQRSWDLGRSPWGPVAGE